MKDERRALEPLNSIAVAGALFSLRQATLRLKGGEVKRKIIWLVVSCLMVAALLLASCAPTVPY
ncbi:hypothetical protein ES703_111633 [subsurface metagenome]